jgi:hypothetical protein
MLSAQLYEGGGGEGVFTVTVEASFDASVTSLNGSQTVCSSEFSNCALTEIMCNNFAGCFLKLSFNFEKMISDLNIVSRG